MTRKMFYEAGAGFGVAILTLTGFYLAGAVGSGLDATNTSSDQQETLQRLNQDLIQSKVELEGWQKEVGRGMVASAEYRTALVTNLNAMHARLQGNYDALAATH